MPSSHLALKVGVVVGLLSVLNLACKSGELGSQDQSGLKTAGKNAQKTWKKSIVDLTCLVPDSSDDTKSIIQYTFSGLRGSSLMVWKGNPGAFRGIPMDITKFHSSNIDRYTFEMEAVEPIKNGQTLHKFKSSSRDSAITLDVYDSEADEWKVIYQGLDCKKWYSAGRG